MTHYGISEETVVERREVNYSPWVRFEGEELFVKLCRKCGGEGDHWSGIDNNEHRCFRCASCGIEPRVGRKTAKQLDSMVKAYAATARRNAAEAHAADLKKRDRDHAYALKVNESFAGKADFTFIAEVGEKVDFTGEVIFTKDIHGDYGTTRMLIVQVSETVKVKMFTGAAWVWEMGGEHYEETLKKENTSDINWYADSKDNCRAIRKGVQVHIKATVKANEVFGNEKSSLLVRPKLITE